MKNFRYIDIADKIEQLINNNTHPAGEKLPSLRIISHQYNVSIGTAIKAFSLLEDKGLIAAREKSGFVALRKSGFRTELPESPHNKPAVKDVRVSKIFSMIPPDDDVHAAKYISFFNATLDTTMTPFNAIRRSIQNASRDLSGRHLQYESSSGSTLLREQIARLSFYWNGALSANDITVTNGALEAISLSLRAVTHPGDTVIVESPCFYGILRCLEELHLKVIELPCNSETGIDIQQLEHIAKTFNVAACVFTSNFNNPNGVLLPDNKKKLIAAFARKHRIPVIEDDVYGDLYFGAHRPTTIKTYDRDGWVMLCASFSKTIAPGYRIGWCAPGRFLEKVTMLKATTNIASASILQLSVAELLSTGAYNRHLRRLRPILQKQVLLSSQTITKHFPAGTRLSQPEGGMVLWIELPEHISAIQLQKAALQHHINIAPGPLFSGNGSFKNYIRISCHHPWDKKVEKAIATLGNITCRMSS